jgi:hypothetical protein
VLITVTLRNVSRSSCVVREDATSPDVEALDPHGRVVWSAGCGASADGATRPCPPRTITPRQLAPGKTRTWTRTWQQRASSGDSSPGPVVPRGSYTLRATQIAQATTMVEVGV